MPITGLVQRAVDVGVAARRARCGASRAGVVRAEDPRIIIAGVLVLPRQGLDSRLPACADIKLQQCDEAKVAPVSKPDRRVLVRHVEAEEEVGVALEVAERLAAAR